MDFKLELIAVPVSDVDRAKAFYTEQAGFNADHDHQVNEEIRFVQLTPPGSACSISIGTGLGANTPPPGSTTRAPKTALGFARQVVSRLAASRQLPPGARE